MSSQFDSAQLDTDLLIEEVKLRPWLYAKDHLKYSDVHYKRKEWEIITKTLFENVWSDYDEDKRTEKVGLVQKRWKNLRACFNREVKRQKDPNWVYGVAYKRRKYMYYKALSFLISECDGADEDASVVIDLPENTNADNTTVSVDTSIEEISIPEPTPMSKSKAKTNKTRIDNAKSASNCDKSKIPSNSDNTKTLSHSDDTNTPSNTNNTKTLSHSDDTNTPSNTNNTETLSNFVNTNIPSNSDSTEVLSNSDNTNTQSSFENTNNPSNSANYKTSSNANVTQDSTNFALSLVPMLNMIPIDERVDAQIQILSILQPFLKKSCHRGGRDVRRLSSRQMNEKMDNIISIENKPDSEEESEGELCISSE